MCFSKIFNLYPTFLKGGIRIKMSRRGCTYFFTEVNVHAFVQKFFDFISPPALNIFGFSPFHFIVCETQVSSHLVEEDVPECELVFEERCMDAEEGDDDRADEDGKVDFFLLKKD